MEEEKKADILSEQADEVIGLKKEIDTKKIEMAELDDRLKRIAAEFDNYKKRNIKEKEMLHSSIFSGIITNFLPIIDNLEKALETSCSDENYKQGVEMVLKQFQDVLNQNGVSVIETKGKTFNPELHEAVSTIVDENLGEKEIKEEYRKGYTINGKVIRHSMVIVAN